jgi:GNAT superfamily N-acetyltransferase
MALDIRKLEPVHDVKAFDCGDVQLNDFLRRFAWENQERHMYGNTYVAYSEDAELIGYYTIANSSIPRIELPEEQVAGSPRYPYLPALLLARLAVAKVHSKKGNGEQLLRHCLNNALALSQEVGVRYVITEAYLDKVAWYAKYGFREVPRSDDSKHRKMWIDLKVVKAAMIKSCNG